MSDLLPLLICIVAVIDNPTPAGPNPLQLTPSVSREATIGTNQPAGNLLGVTIQEDGTRNNFPPVKVPGRDETPMTLPDASVQSKRPTGSLPPIDLPTMKPEEIAAASPPSFWNFLYGNTVGRVTNAISNAISNAWNNLPRTGDADTISVPTLQATKIFSDAQRRRMLAGPSPRIDTNQKPVWSWPGNPTDTTKLPDGAFNFGTGQPRGVDPAADKKQDLLYMHNTGHLPEGVKTLGGAYEPPAPITPSASP